MGRIHRLNGRNVFYIDSGTDQHELARPTLLLLHGFPTSSWDWHSLWPLLSDSFRLVALDFLGFGFSDKPYPHEYSIAEQATITRQLIQALKLGPFHVLAHNYGDCVAAELMAQLEQHPIKHWQSLCLLNAGILAEAYHYPRLQQWLASPLGRYAVRQINVDDLNRMLKQSFGPDHEPDLDWVEGCWAAINNNNGLQPLEALASFIKQRKKYRRRWINGLQASAIPTTFINGNADPIAGKHLIEKFKAVIGAPLMTINLSEVGHYPQLEAPIKTSMALRQILDAVQQKRRTQDNGL